MTIVTFDRQRLYPGFRRRQSFKYRTFALIGDQALPRLTVAGFHEGGFFLDRRIFRNKVRTSAPPIAIDFRFANTTLSSSSPPCPSSHSPTSSSFSSPPPSKPHTTSPPSSSRIGASLTSSPPSSPTSPAPNPTLSQPSSGPPSLATSQ